MLDTQIHRNNHTNKHILTLIQQAEWPKSSTEKHIYRIHTQLQRQHRVLLTEWYMCHMCISPFIHSFIRSTLFRVSFRNLYVSIEVASFRWLHVVYALLPYFSFIGEREPKCRSWRSGWKGDRNVFRTNSNRTFVCIRSFGFKLSPFHILSHSAVDCFSSTFVWLLVH